MKKDSVSDSPANAEHIVGVALSAFEQGAGHLKMNPPAVESFRNQLIRTICTAFDRPGWQADWRREKGYLFAYAEAMGLWAAALASEEGRRFITLQDIHSAAVMLRGYTPVIDRWCPL
jgi:hypothetical protein